MLFRSPRCGTTTLSRCLSKHPQILFSKPKEPHYFSRISRDGRLTLVVDRTHGVDVGTRWSSSPRRRLEEAVADLARSQGHGRNISDGPAGSPRETDWRRAD